jgi:hypothetical protein
LLCVDAMTSALSIRDPRRKGVTSPGGSQTSRVQMFLVLASTWTILAACHDAGSGSDSNDAKRRTLPPVVEGTCVVAGGNDAPEYLEQVGCSADFEGLASEPIDATLPGARSAKVVLDQADNNHLYFQNSVLYQIHYQFASTHLSGNGLPIVPPLAEFNTTEYFSPDRRFILGAVTHYDGPQMWALEISPYDTASAAMITALYGAVQNVTFFGPALVFHPTSENVQVEANKLSDDVYVVTTDELYGGIDYQPLSLATGIGRLQFVTVASLEDTYLSHEALIVIDEAPNDITVVQGIVSQEFQTPLSHVNVLSQNRHTPNMGLRNAMHNETLRAFEGALVELTVTASAWNVRAVTDAEAAAFWEAHRPAAVVLPSLDLTVTGLYDIEDVTSESSDVSLRDSIKNAIHAFGGKAAQYSILAKTANVPVRKAFAAPVFYYDQFMTDNGFFDQLDTYLADASFVSDYRVRDQKLAELRAAMLRAPIAGDFQALLRAKLDADYPGVVMRFRTSTNSEDLEGFPCAGCYESHSGDPSDWEDILQAIRLTYASAWLFRSFEERSYYGVDHKSVGMALLVHHNFPDEEANGVGITNNPFDETGLSPAFYVNVQYGGDVEVVHPQPGIASDQFLYYYYDPNQPVTYLSHSSLVLAGDAVLTGSQIHTLGATLDAIHNRFSAAYGPAAGNNGWYAMDVEFKFDNDDAPNAPPALYIKQARPYPGRGQ